MSEPKNHPDKQTHEIMTALFKAITNLNDKIDLLSKPERIPTLFEQANVVKVKRECKKPSKKSSTKPAKKVAKPKAKRGRPKKSLSLVEEILPDTPYKKTTEHIKNLSKGKVVRENFFQDVGEFSNESVKHNPALGTRGIARNVREPSLPIDMKCIKCGRTDKVHPSTVLYDRDTKMYKYRCNNCCKIPA